METNQFQDMDFIPEIKKAVEAMGFKEMTEIQVKAIPAMTEGRDIIAKAPTGTGKTCAFGIPIIQRVDPENNAPQALILSPTRELATQIGEELSQLAQFLPQIRVVVVYGGQNMERQKEKLRKGAHIVVATPGRLLDHIKHRNISLKTVTTVVLDEADRMLDMGFFKDVRHIIDQTVNRKQLAMFSATISREVMDIGWLYQRDPAEFTVLPVKDSEPKITQYAIQSIGRQKLDDICDLITKLDYKRCIIFCNTKYSTNMLSGQLSSRGFDADCLNGDMRQSDRNAIMSKFKDGKLAILVATDVAARGIDVTDVEAVFNYDLAQDNDSHLHRIGRTGRAKREGASYIFYTEDDMPQLKKIIRYTHAVIHPVTFDENRNIIVAEEPMA